MKILLLAAGSLLFGATAVQANSKSDVRQQCDAFKEANFEAYSAENGLKGRKTLLPPQYPFSYAAEEYVCVWIKYDVNADGRTENARVVFKAPSDASERFDKAALRSVAKWRYDPPTGENAWVEGVLTELTFETY